MDTFIMSHMDDPWTWRTRVRKRWRSRREPEQEVPPPNPYTHTYNDIYSLGGSIDNMSSLVDSLRYTTQNMS
jgi:hypothetical protein